MLCALKHICPGWWFLFISLEILYFNLKLYHIRNVQKVEVYFRCLFDPVFSLHFYARHNCPSQDVCLFMTKAIKSRCAQLYWERNSPKAHVRYVNWLCNHLVNINDECSYEEDTVSRNKEIMGQMWSGSFFLWCFLSQPFYFICIGVLIFLHKVKLCFMVIGNRIFGHLLVPKPFFKTSTVMLTNIYSRRKKLTGSFKAYYFHFNTHSICYFREYNYFSNT